MADRYQGIIDVCPWSGAFFCHGDRRERTGMENELRRVVDPLPGLVWTALPDGSVDLLNQRWREYTGLTVAEGCGRGWQTAIHPEGLPELPTSLLLPRGLRSLRCPISTRVSTKTNPVIRSRKCQEKASSYRFRRGRIAVEARSGPLGRTIGEDECWRSPSDSDHRLGGGVRSLNTSFAFR
jgi:PAS domain-containing protein